jgi:peptidoglycan/xylan/chitin deacetylase (PgdA/CDA1 family)
MKKILLLALGVSILLSGCGGFTTATSTPTSHPVEIVPSLPPTETATFTPTSTPTPTFTHQPAPTSTRVAQGPGLVTVPILLYHRIDISSNNSRYYVAPQRFEEQMKLLHDWGYTSITTTMLIQAINEGAELPPRPFLLTFDDGNLDNYTNAFPITKKYGFTGVLYLVSSYVGTEGYMNVEQIREMVNAGWEVGSHGMKHLDLTELNPALLRKEIVQSREALEEKLGVPVLTFAYPFGEYNNAALDYVRFAGYIGAMGTSSYTAVQGTWNLYYLQRAEIKGSDDAKTFTRFLPWHGDPAFLPTDTPTPSATPSRTPKP